MELHNLSLLYVSGRINELADAETVTIPSEAYQNDDEVSERLRELFDNAYVLMEKHAIKKHGVDRKDIREIELMLDKAFQSWLADNDLSPMDYLPVYR